jgi:hypothetical protein
MIVWEAFLLIVRGVSLAIAFIDANIYYGANFTFIFFMLSRGIFILLWAIFFFKLSRPNKKLYKQLEEDMIKKFPLNQIFCFVSVLCGVLDVSSLRLLPWKKNNANANVLDYPDYPDYFMLRLCEYGSYIPQILQCTYFICSFTEAQTASDKTRSMTAFIVSFMYMLYSAMLTLIKLQSSQSNGTESSSSREKDQDNEYDMKKTINPIYPINRLSMEDNHVIVPQKDGEKDLEEQQQINSKKLGDHQVSPANTRVLDKSMEKFGTMNKLYFFNKSPGRKPPDNNINNNDEINKERDDKAGEA